MLTIRRGCWACIPTLVPMEELNDDPDESSSEVSPILPTPAIKLNSKAPSMSNQHVEKKSPSARATLQQFLFHSLLKFLYVDDGPDKPSQEVSETSSQITHSVPLGDGEDLEHQARQLRDEARSLAADRLSLFQKATEAFRSLGRHSGGAGAASFYARQVREMMKYLTT